MDIHKLSPDTYEVLKHWHMPILMGLAGFIKFTSGIGLYQKNSDLGDVPGDNILSNEILFSISSRRGLGAL